MENNENIEKKEEKSNLSFFEPVKEYKPDAQSSMKKNLLVLALGSIAGLISALVANMLASTISIMFWAFTSNGPMYNLVRYGQLFVYTILLYVFCYWMFRKWDHTKTNKAIFLSSYFLLYIVMFLIAVV